MKERDPNIQTEEEIIAASEEIRHKKRDSVKHKFPYSENCFLGRKDNVIDICKSVLFAKLLVKTFRFEGFEGV